MRKTCALWAKPVLGILFVVIGIVAAWSIAPLSAQSADPSTQPRLAATDLMYVGGFRLPATTINNDHFQFGGRQLAFNPANNSLFVGSRAGRVAEVSIPNALNSSNPAAMPFASYLQGFSDPTEGRLSQILTDGVALDGLLVVNNRLIGTASVFYDADNLQRVSHYSRSTRLDEPSFRGWSSVWNATRTGFVSGQMAVIPSEWRSLLGGDAATGQCCIPIVSRTSFGPSAFAFNASDVGQTTTTVPASPLLYYTGDHTTLGPWEGSNPTYGSTTFMGGMAIIAGTRTALYFGRNGMGPSCYGNGTNNQALHGTLGPDGAHYCYDPTNSDKGSHAYPYRYQIWAYDLNDFAAVKAGTKQPWEVVPYGVWPLELPTPETVVRLGGVGYDPVHQRLYVSQMYADVDGYASRPVVHVLQINAAGSNVDDGSFVTDPNTDPVTAPPPPTEDTTPPPPTTTLPADTTGSTVVRSISLAVSRNSPQLVGTPITFTASVVGGITPHEYKWMLFNAGSWQVLNDWSTMESFTWTPGTASPNYRVGVWARSSGNTNDEAEASVSTRFAITAPSPVRAVTFGADKPAPQVFGTAITFTATAVGGQAVEYKWLMHDGLSWSALTDWSRQNAFLWTPAAANSGARIGVWARSSGNTTGDPDATFSMDYPVTAPVVPVRGVTISADKPAPQPAGTSIVFNGVVDGGSAVQYKWLVHDGLSWKAVTGWSSQTAFLWTPAAANAGARIGLWVRSNGNQKDEPEATFSIDYAISAPVAAAAPAPAAVPVRSVTFSANKPAPQPAGSTVTFTAAVDGGVNVEYKWLMHDGLNWSAISGWSSANTLTWTPAAANPAVRIGLWVRSNANTRDEPEATWSADYAIAPKP